MASINVSPANTDDKTIRIETVRVLAHLENTALKDGTAHEGNVACTRNRRSYGWAINGNRCSKQDAANSIAASMEASATLKAEKSKRTSATKGEAKPRRERKPKVPAEPKAKGPTRKEQIIEMLRSPGGTTIDAIVARFGVLRHSARASVSVFGREIGGVSYDKETKVYRATAA